MMVRRYITFTGWIMAAALLLCCIFTACGQEQGGENMAV